MADPALAFEDLGHAYRPGQFVFRCLAGALWPGHVLAVLAPNGGGKTTLLRILTGSLTPVEGRTHVAGRVAFVPQLFEVAFDFSVLDMVLMGRARRVGLFSVPGAADHRAAWAALERLGLAALAARPFSELSGGQRQLVILARALAAEAEILVLDEPTSALDLRNQALILSQVGRLAREDGLAVLFTTHQPQHALAVADDVLLLGAEGGALSGPARNVLTETRLSALYGVPMRLLSVEHEGSRRDALVPLF